MTGPAEPPLLFLDVDGTLLPLAGARLPTTLEGWGDWEQVTNPQLAKIDAGHGPRLLALPCALVWATAWMHRANAVIGPLLGLPGLPVAELPEAPMTDAVGELNWKTRALVEAAAGRTFVWVDDAITDVDRAWVASHHAGQALLLGVDSGTGLTGTDLAVVADWLRQVGSYDGVLCEDSDAP
ncbi:HAD domain-containing protein [Streptomyces sp. NPDC047081]|uniref:HAD domain-containing protein n=1 Tax=Streptomyces sp. NPDC047081 TaxID=3154706 RepID=UPI0033ED299C